MYKDAGVASIAQQIATYETQHMHTRDSTTIMKRFIIDPRTSVWIGWWDGIISLALVFTAIVTPIEVGFMGIPEDRWEDPLFLVNRFVDLVFIYDLCLQFVLMYPSSETQDGIDTTAWVEDFQQIGRHYLLSWWFVLDVFSIGVSGFDIFSPDNSSTQRFKALRAVRVLRLLKLLRLLRGSRIFKRWEMRLSINYALLSIVNICVMLAFVCHLFACIWGLQASFEPLDTWLGQKGYCVVYNASLPCPADMRCDAIEGWMCTGSGQTYLYSLYWAIATVTSIGYGDVAATPFNESEQIAAVIMMLFGSLTFAYLIGSFSGLASNLSPDVRRFRQDLTDLNKFLTANHIPSGLRYQLREFLHQTVYLRNNATGNRLLSEMAPKLRNEVALTINKKNLLKIDLLRDECEQGLILELAFSLTLGIFPPGDYCPNGHIYIVSRGAALFAGHVKLPGTSWGEADALLTTDRLRFAIPAMALSYLFTFSLDGATLRSTMAQAKYPYAAARLRRKQIHWIMRRGLVRAAQDSLAKTQRRSMIISRHLGETGLGHIVRAAQAAAKIEGVKAPKLERQTSRGKGLELKATMLERQSSRNSAQMREAVLQLEKQHHNAALQKQIGSSAGRVAQVPSVASHLGERRASSEQNTTVQREGIQGVMDAVNDLRREMMDMRRAHDDEAQIAREMREMIFEELKRLQSGVRRASQ